VSETFEKLKEYLGKIQRYGQAATLLFWDMDTGMPKEGFEGHSQALTFFSTEQFKLSTAQELKEYLAILNSPEEFENLDQDWQFIVKRMQRELLLDEQIPVDFYSAYVQAQTDAGKAWEEAKKASDFSIFQPHLATMIEMTKQMMAYRYPDKEIYDAMLNQYEEGMDSATIDRLFEELKAGLIPLVDKILSAKQPDDSKFHRYFDIDSQKKVQKLLLDYIGFSWDKGTVGESEHPYTLNFCSKDVRITNHFHEDDVLSAMFSAIHEGGHAIFEQNVDPKLDHTVAGSCCYMGLHESQSRFYENVLARNENFWIPIYGKIQELLPGLSDVSCEEFAREVNHVRNSFIRTEADEVTYCLHIIIRYEIEKAIFRDGVSVEELPKLWNEKMQEYLKITPQNDTEGILQDMHWSDGSFGYFPTYLLGSIYDGMFLDALEQDLGSVDAILKEGRIREITEWLNRKIHVYGSTRLPKDVIEAVCGKEVSAEPLLRYFNEKYTKIYNL
jgi:carboxypeptidase Taq